MILAYMLCWNQIWLEIFGINVTENQVTFANPDGYFQVQKRLGKHSSATFMVICVALYITNVVAFKKKKRESYKDKYHKY